MDAFLKKFGAEASAVADQLMSNYSVTAETDKRSFLTVLAFLHEFPDTLSKRGKFNAQPDTIEYFSILATKFFSHRYNKERPAEPKTVPDPMVRKIMAAFKEYEVGHAARTEREHQLSMAAENMVGSLLERYVASVLEPHGWAWCSGDFIRAVDLLKPKPGGGWVILQIKNRDNSENSSSSAIRKNTEIKKWFRTFARTGATNWSAFPDEVLNKKLSEEAFEQFVVKYLKTEKGS